jgi:hypothetical protein
MPVEFPFVDKLELVISVSLGHTLADNPIEPLHRTKLVISPVEEQKKRYIPHQRRHLTMVLDN